MFYDTTRLKKMNDHIDLHDWVTLSHEELDEIERLVDSEIEHEESLKREQHLQDKYNER